jgi:hypothetical protein
MSRIVIIHQQTGEQTETISFVAADDYNFNIWVHRWFTIHPVAIEVHENLYSVTCVCPTHVQVEAVIIAITAQLQQEIEDNAEDYRMCMVRLADLENFK